MSDRKIEMSTVGYLVGQIFELHLLRSVSLTWCGFIVEDESVMLLVLKWHLVVWTSFETLCPAQILEHYEPAIPFL